jgi:uncharacterized protein (TIGR02996 family)
VAKELTEHKAFLKAIRKCPTDLTARLVFADWLDEHDEAPLAEFIRVSSLMQQLAHRMSELRQQLPKDVTKVLPFVAGLRRSSGSKMKLKSPHIATRLNPTADFVRQAFRRVAGARLDDGPFLILGNTPGFVQTYRERGGWHVEFALSGDVGPFYRLPELVSESRAAVVFEDYLAVGDGLSGLYPWVDITAGVVAAITKNKPERAGGYPRQPAGAVV